nr:sulfur carrier protein ThiS [Desulfobacterales bacterium]
MQIAVKLNGERRSFDRNMTILRLLEMLKIPPGSIVVEHNRKILYKDMFEHTILEDGDELELIRFVGGG